MIARLEGCLREKAPTRIVVDVRGVGYELLIPLSTFAELPDEGKTVALHVHTHAREGAIQLFGFYSAPERAAFDLLLRASRVGPKLAQTILSGISPAALLAAVRGGGAVALRAVPGVGPKLADRVLLELRDRTAELAAAVAAEEPSAGAPGVGEGGSARDQALSALLNLGYPKTQAERVLAEAAAAAGPDAPIESLVRAALRMLAR